MYAMRRRRRGHCRGGMDARFCGPSLTSVMRLPVSDHGAQSASPLAACSPAGILLSPQETLLSQPRRQVGQDGSPWGFYALVWNHAGRTRERMFLDPKTRRVPHCGTDRVGGHGWLNELVETVSHPSSGQGLFQCLFRIVIGQ